MGREAARKQGKNRALAELGSGLREHLKTLGAVPVLYVDKDGEQVGSSTGAAVGGATTSSSDSKAFKNAKSSDIKRSAGGGVEKDQLGDSSSRLRRGGPPSSPGDKSGDVDAWSKRYVLSGEDNYKSRDVVVGGDHDVPAGLDDTGAGSVVSWVGNGLAYPRMGYVSDHSVLPDLHKNPCHSVVKE